VISIEDPRLLRVIRERIDAVIGTTPATLQREVRESLLEGIQANETLAELRLRVDHTYKGFASPAKVLQVARTESGAMANDVRQLMFEDAGITTLQWVTAGGEVRPDHQVLGALGPKPIGYNYMEALGKPGTLRHPHDMAAPAGQVVNCRCALVPAIEE
jgi:hypothetical protein